MKKWVPFQFEGNEAWSYITSRTEWIRIKEIYKKIYPEKYIKLLKNCRELGDDYYNCCPARHIEFGLYDKHCGDRTLIDFFKQHNMRF